MNQNETIYFVLGYLSSKQTMTRKEIDIIVSKLKEGLLIKEINDVANDKE